MPKVTFVFKLSIVVTVIGVFVGIVNNYISVANRRVRDAIQNDRPCNFLLDYNDAYILTHEIVEKYGYPVERHWVTTEDGYILEMQRIPQINGRSHRNSKSSPNEKSNENHSQIHDRIAEPKPAVILIHGFISSSRDFVINCDRRALAFQLWENGYDVWMGNYRGNKYSRNHTRLSPDSAEFWDFSLNEIGYHDFPAMIDYTLSTTALKKVSIVGFSMGNGVTMAMLSMLPEYNDKIDIWFGMSTSVTFQDTNSPFLRFLSAIPHPLAWLIATLNHGELIPPLILKIWDLVMPTLCRFEGENEGSFHGICSCLNFMLDGYSPGQIPPKMYSLIAGGMPSPTSFKFLLHWIQWTSSGNFTLYDFGPEENMEKYGSAEPKKISLANIKTRAVVLYGENDAFVTVKGMHKMKVITTSLNPASDPFEYVKIEPHDWNHMSFTHGKDADIYVYSHILSRLKQVYQNLNQSSFNPSSYNQ